MAMGAHAAPLVRPPTPVPTLTLLLLFLLVLLCSDAVIVSFGDDQDSSSQALLKFKSSLSDIGGGGDALANWNTSSTNPCSGAGMSWTGVICSEGNVWGLQLENLSLMGEIDVDSLVALPQLRTLSFMNNKFKGPMPEFRKLGALKSLYLSNNQFSEDIPDDAFVGMASLKKVYMANNQFSGTIPTSLAASPRLLELRLENNQFVGPIPDFSPDLKLLNVSNNQLDGPIPTSLINMDPTSFSGNKGLCGKPLDSICNSSSPPPAADPIDTPTPPHTKEKPSPLRIVVMVIAGLVGLAALVLLLILVYRSIRRSQTPQLGRTSTSSYNKNKVAPSSQGNRSVEHTSEMSRPGPGPSRKQGDQLGKLSFVRDDRERFELQDLLRASAEVLGSGSFGSSYKAVLMDGQAVVVKRFKQMNSVGREEFHEHMRRLGRLRHPNLLPLVAYYYRKEEKLLVFDYMHNGSLASQLHGNHSVDKPGLDWPKRLKVIKGVVKGLAYLYSELPSLIVPHGHLKSSNVVLDNSFEPLLMDYTLVPVVNAEAAHQLMVAYKSPECAQHGRPTKKTDVWSLGILILETLTGKFPANYLAQGADLASWVNSIIGEEMGTQVFDKEMGSTNNAQGEMLKLLRIGVSCCEEDLETRLDLKEAVERIELLKERDAP